LAGLGVALGLAIGYIIFFRTLPAPTSESREAAPAPVSGAPAPDFRLAALGGERIQLADLEGRVVLINFWATWCGPCTAEMPLLEDRYTTYKDSGFTILAVNVDEDVDVIRPFVDRYALTFPILLDPGSIVHDLYRVRGYPTSLFIDRDGVITDIHVGALLDEQLDAYLGGLGIGTR
jgi:peroxiredoxin